MKTDKIYNKPIKNNKKFTFDKKTVAVFENMINRSVPNYKFVVDMTGAISQNFIKSNTNYYDLGCSLGATTYSVIKNNSDKNFCVFAVDNSMPMIKKAEANLSLDKIPKSIFCNFIFEDICGIAFSDVSFVSMNFVLQFVDPLKRRKLFKKIYDGMLENSCLVLSEKIKFNDASEDAFEEELQVLFKKQNGYSNLEISQKRTALEDVLVRESFEEYKAQLQEIGYRKVYRWFQSFNFVSICAIK